MAEARTDPLSEAERSARMARVRGAGNESTEGRVEAALVAAGVEGWEKHPKGVLGKPDFYFPRQRLAVFVDGCFWHGCPVCARRTPTARAALGFRYQWSRVRESASLRLPPGSRVALPPPRPLRVE